MDRKKTNLVSLFSALAIILLLLTIAGIIACFIIFEVRTWILITLPTALYFAQSITAFWILNSRRIINVKLCWIFIIYFVPFFGLAGFFIFGVIPLKVRSLREFRIDNEKFNQYENYDFTNHHLKKFPKDDYAFCYNYSGSPIYDKNKYEFIDQSELVKVSLEIIEKAKEVINVQYYIIAESIWLNLVIEALIKKAKEGLKVRFLYDWAGAHKRIKKTTIQKLLKGGVEVEIFNPKNFNQYTSNTNFRSHRKSIIVDNKYCLTGGSNLSDEYLNLKMNYENWIDLNFLIEGQIVNSINLQFYNDWINFSSFSLKKRDSINLENELIVHNDISTKVISQVINSGPTSSINPFLNVLISKISCSQEKITIVSPYFLLHDSIVSLLICTALRGVQIELIFPHYPDDKKYILTMNRSNYLRMLEANIKIYEYKGFVHSKFITFDSEYAILGTNNMDYRSLLINFETGILINSSKIVKELDEIKNSYLKNSIVMTKENFKTYYKTWSKIQINFINMIHPLL